MAIRQKIPKSASKIRVRKPNTALLAVLSTAFLSYFRLCGVRIKATDRVGTMERPSIILCNHGSFVDFVFAASLLRKYAPNFIVARLYFYDRCLRALIRAVGGFPKSMFARDTESTKNCLQVLRDGGVLAMMPEARLSTVGRFEDIQPSTYAFIKKCGVPVYTVRFEGDYLADPKWGKGFRRGAVVEATLDILYTASEVQSLSVEQIRQGVEQRLAYDEQKWLTTRPALRYRSRRMAEGLENILTLCPVCGRKHSLVTKGRTVFCEHCGRLTSLNDRYEFTDGFVFATPAEWYDWQKDALCGEIKQNKAFALSAQVELRLPSRGRGLTRHGGRGVCTLDRDGLHYRGTKDGETVELQFPLRQVYRLLFGAGTNFEIYDGTEILFFVPQEKRSAVDWYLASMILYDESLREAVC